MADRYTKVLLTVIAINLTVLVGYGAAKFFVPDVVASSVQTVRIDDTFPIAVKVCSPRTDRCAEVAGISTNNGPEVNALLVGNMTQN